MSKDQDAALIRERIMRLIKAANLVARNTSSTLETKLPPPHNEIKLGEVRDMLDFWLRQMEDLAPEVAARICSQALVLRNAQDALVECRQIEASRTLRPGTFVALPFIHPMNPLYWWAFSAAIQQQMARQTLAFASGLQSLQAALLGLK